MQSVTLVGIDLGKHSLHLHGQDRNGKAVFRRKVNRKQLIEFFAALHSCTVVMEACSGAHYMARGLTTPLTFTCDFPGAALVLANPPRC